MTKLGNITAPRLAVGCMRLPGCENPQKFVQAAFDMGLNFFDHADIYGGGESEKIFAEAAKSIPREKLILQSKCGIRSGFFDFSKDYILQSVDGILKRLNTDYLDLLLLHRPDALVEPEEVAAAFDALFESGKVRQFGVSNHKPMQIELLKKYVKQPIAANQLQLSITNAEMIGNGLRVNMSDTADRDGSVLDYCRLNDITIQPWSPLQYGFFEGVFLGNEKYPQLNATLDKFAEKYCVSNTAMAFAWLARHPAKFQPVTGTTNISRLKDCLTGMRTEITREEWYAIWTSAGNVLP